MNASKKAIAHAKAELAKLKAGKERKHKKYAASASERWFECAGSVALSKDAPKPEESKYAIEGTMAHLVLETLFIDASTATIKALEKLFNPEMVAHGLAALKAIRSFAPRGAQVYSESEAPLDHLHPDAGGTCDVVIVEEFGTLTVIDYKYGTKLVSPVENKQLLAYAISKAKKHDYNFSSIRLVIVQPRVKRKAGPVSQWECKLSHLLDWERKFKSAITKAEKKNAPLVSGAWCFFCPARPLCPVQHDAKLERAREDFPDLP